MSISGALASILLVVGVTACAGRSDTTSPLTVPKLAAGTIFVVADIVDAPFPENGGLFSVLRTDVANAAATSVSIPCSVSDGCYGYVDVPPGTYRVSYKPPDGYDVLAGGSDYTLSDGTGITTMVVRPNVGQWVTFEVSNKSP
jgi:hypothetical protein